MSKQLIKNKKPLITYINILLGDTIGKYLITILAISIFLLPILHVYTPEENIFHISAYTISLLGKYFTLSSYK